jgi:signal transduction histidine kinase
MNEMLDRLEDARDRQANFVSDASHELRTPLAVIRTELEVALRSEGTDHWREVATDVLDEDLRMQRLVDDLLFIAKHEGLADRHERFLVDVDDLVLAELRRGSFARPVDASDVSAGQVRGNPDHLARVIRNLLENADRHAHSRVAVHVTSADGLVTLDVDDDGPGVPEADRELVFERFGRSDTARSRATGGAGLGLAIVNEIVTELDGQVTVSRSPWLGGARFTVSLPDARC